MKRPNILLVVMDTQRADNMSCYGYPRSTTPNVDRIASEGAVFLNHITAGVWTLPSHASLFTGRYVSGHGADANYEALPAEFPTMAEILGKLGYQTVGFSNNGWVSRRTGVARGFQEFYLVRRGREGRVEWFYVEEFFRGEGEEDKGSLKTVNAAASWIKKRWDREKPFFMFINFIEPHGPYWPPEPFRSRFLPPGVSEEEAKSVPMLRSTVECVDVRAGALKLSERDWLIEKALYDGCTATVDDRIGKLYSFLEDQGLADETLVVITSDHGDVQGEHDPPGVEHHACAYDELVRIPLVVRYPEVVPEGAKIKWVSQNVDVLPTILDILGVRGTEHWRTLQGVSLLPSMTADKPAREYALVEYNSLQLLFLIWARHPNFDVRRYGYRLKALRSLKYKYIWYSNGRDELYDLESDPGERKNIAGERPDIVQMMRSELEKMLLSIEIVDYGDMQLRERRLKPFGEKADEVFARLKAWGFYREVRPAKLLEEEDSYV